MSEKVSTLFYHDWLDTFEELTDEEVGQLCKAILKFDIDGTTPTFQDKTLKILFSQMSNVTKRNRKKYTEKCEKNSNNRKRTLTNVNERKQSSTNATDIDIDIDKDIDKDKEKDIDTESGSGRDTEHFEQLQPLPELENQELNIIRHTWNSRICTLNIGEIPPFSKRYDSIKLCIGYTGIEKFLKTIGELDDQEYFVDQAKLNNKVKFDWFVNPNNYLKVREGNYKEAYKKEEEFDLEAWAKNG